MLLIGFMIGIACLVSAQDFASRFMEEMKPDTCLRCISISPKMIEEVLKINMEKEDARVREIISNLKSIRMVIAKTNGPKYYKKAISLLEKNLNRFDPYLSYKGKFEHYRILVRKRKGVIVELVMLANEKSKFTVVNFTGIMDDEFIDKLANSIDIKHT